MLSDLLGRHAVIRHNSIKKARKPHIKIDNGMSAMIEHVPRELLSDREVIAASVGTPSSPHRPFPDHDMMPHVQGESRRVCTSSSIPREHISGESQVSLLGSGVTRDLIWAVSD